MMNKTKNYNSPLIDELLKEITPAEQEKTNKRMLLAAHIADALSAKGWKKKDFAEAMSKTPSEITKWLSGTHNFTLDTLFEIEKILNINLITPDNKPKEKDKAVIYFYSLQSVPNIQESSPANSYGKSSSQTLC